MRDFHPHSKLPFPYPRNLTVPQFLLDETVHPLRPSREPTSRWLIDGATGRPYCLAEIRQRVEQIARAAKARWDLQPGDVVCLYSPNHIDYPVVIWAMHRLGCTVTGANPLYTIGELEFQLKETSSKLLFTSPASFPKALDAATRAGLLSSSNIVLLSSTPAVSTLGEQSTAAKVTTVGQLVTEGSMLDKNYDEPRGASIGDTVAFLGLSSGTTGLPKAVAVSHRGVIAVMLQMAYHNRANDETIPEEHRWINPGDLAIGVLPFYHIYGLVGALHSQLFGGAGIVVVPGFQLEHFVATIAKYKITHLAVVPPIIVQMLHNPLTTKYDLSHVRWVLSGGAPISADVIKDLRSMLPQAKVGVAYGLTETSTLATLFDAFGPPADGSCGVLAPDTYARVVKTDGTSADYDEPGEIWVKGPQVALGYLNNKKATEETFLPDGWVRTGDEGYVSREGNVYIVDRLKELIKVSGFQVAPAELEGHLLAHPYVEDVGVIGVPDDRKGEVPMAFIVLKGSVSRRATSGAEQEQRIKQELSKWVSDQKVRYKWLDGGVQLVDAIPKVPSGKILRRVLREQWNEQRKEGVQAKL